jgi:hypothetical protein
MAMLYGLENSGTTGTAAQQADLTNVLSPTCKDAWFPKNNF